MIILEIEQLVIALLFVAALVGILVKRLRMPYTVGLVIVGLGFAIINPQLALPEEFGTWDTFLNIGVPNLILGLLVPPLIFEAAFHIQLRPLLKELPLILTFAIPGVVLTMFLVGGIIGWGTSLSMPLALTLGALLAATDPVAVISLFRAIGAPKRLSLLMEGESLFNDGTAVVIFHIMLAVVATGEFNLLEGIGEFLLVAMGGLVIGAGVGFIISRIINRVDDYLIEMGLTTVAAYSAYLIGEHYHVSGVLAVVAAGLVSGNIGPRGMSEITQSRLIQFWEYTAYLANSFIFLLIGLVIDLGALWANIGPILLAILGVLLARGVVIYFFSAIFRSVPIRLQHVLYWGGLRGAISLALALSLTSAEVGASLSLMQSMAFGVVLFTLLVQGTTMETLMEKLKLVVPG